MTKNSRISKNFSSEIDKVLNGTYKKHNQVKAKDYTPLILVRCGVKNLPMLITAKHILSTILTEEEARNKGLLISKKSHYHGLGKDLLIKVIANLDNPLAIYKQNNNNYLIITRIYDKKCRNIIVPIELNAKGTYNNFFIDENQIKSVYGHSNLDNYLNYSNFELIYKKGIGLNERVISHNIGNSVNKNISQKNIKVKS